MLASRVTHFKRRLSPLDRDSSFPDTPRPEGTETPAWAVTLVRWLDDGFVIPGTRFGVGLDALLGFIFPTLGDAATGLASLSLLILAFHRGVPRVVILRMVMNIGLDTLLGSVPLFGDAFDLFWRSNRRNLELIERFEHDPTRRATALDYALVTLGVSLVIAAIVLPIVLGFALLQALFRALSG